MQQPVSVSDTTGSTCWLRAVCVAAPCTLLIKDWPFDDDTTGRGGGGWRYWRRGVLWSEIVNTSKALSLIRHKDENPSPWRHNKKRREAEVGVHLWQQKGHRISPYIWHIISRYDRRVLLISAANLFRHAPQIRPRPHRDTRGPSEWMAAPHWSKYRTVNEMWSCPGCWRDEKPACSWFL